MNTSRDVGEPLTLAQRLWIYQRERFPLGKTALLIAAFSSASLNVSATLGHRPLPEIWTYLVMWLATVLIFFQLRACDEWKDAATDRRFRPELPIPRGLVSLRVILQLAAASILPILVLSFSLTPSLTFLLCLIWLWLALMTREFFVPTWLRAHPFVYLVSHMLIMPLVDLFVTAGDWLVHGAAPPVELTWFLGLSFVNGCVLEVGRKMRAPETERDGVETYSQLLGILGSTYLWIGFVFMSFLLLLGVGFALGSTLPIGVAGAAGAALCFGIAREFAQTPTSINEKRLDAAAGLWVALCYVSAGYLPLLTRLGQQ